METIEAILNRRSIRRYKPDAIPPKDLKDILEACRQAPSAGNRQPWHLVLVGDQTQKMRLAKACNGQMWMADAAYIIVGVGFPALSERWYKVDVAIAMQNLVVAASSLGYGTCWIGAFSPDQVRAVCELPEGAEVVACTPLGVPEVIPPARPRKDWDELFSSERYGRPLRV